MPFELRLCTKEDAQESTQLIIESYKNNSFRKIVFPNGMGKASMDKIVESRIKAVDDPDQHPIKIVDTETGEMAACALWAHTKVLSEIDWDREKQEVMHAFPETRRDLLEPFVMKEQETKRRIMDNTRWWELEALNTLPKYQRQGIGSMLMQWGTDRLEEMQIPGFIIATDQGYGLYIKHGFKEVERWEVDLDQWSQLGGKGIYKNVFLTRQPSRNTAV